MVLGNLTWRLGASGTVLNDDPAFVGDPFIDIMRARGFDSAPARMAEHDHEGMDGGFVDAVFEKSRPIALEGVLYSDVSSIMGILDGLKAEWAPGPATKQLYVKWPSLTERILNVKTIGVAFDIDTAMRIGTTPVQFTAIAEDPRFYDSTQLIVNIPLGATVFTGFSFPFTFSFSFGGTTTITDGKTITNYGNRDTGAILRIYGPSVNPSIISDTDSLQLDFNTTINSGEYLEIDLAAHSVRLNGIINRRNTLLAPNWFLLSPGSTFIRYQAESGSTGSSVDVIYSSAWR